MLYRQRMVKTLQNVSIWDIKNKIRTLCDAAGLSLNEASLKIGMNQTYLQQFVTRESPKRLKEAQRADLAKLLNVSEQELTDYDLSSNHNKSAMDRDVIADIIISVENWLDENNYTLDPVNKATLILALYDKVANEPKESRQAKIYYLADFAYQNLKIG